MASLNKNTISSEHLIGRVKWFNNKSGYGFITVTDGSRSGSDIFAHHSVINVENQQYKYLVQGEYVEFDLVKTESTKHEWQASNVSGIKGGKLMCETRHELSNSRNEYKTTSTISKSTEQVEVTSSTTTMPREKRTTNNKTTRPQKTSPLNEESVKNNNTNDKDWSLAGRKNKKVVNRQGSKTSSK